jgi:hypothetical protein
MQQKSIVLFALLFAGQLFSHQSVFAQKHLPFAGNENMSMSVYYNWGFIWVHAGEVEFKTSPQRFRGKECTHIVATGTSLKKWSFIFTLKDYYQSTVDLNGFKPLHYEKNTMEGGYWIHNIYDFYWEKQQLDVFTESKRFAAKDTTYLLNTPLFDVLTATYYLRTLDTDSLIVGDTINVPVISDGEFDTYHIVYSGLGYLKKKKEQLSCHVYKAVIAKSTFFSQKDPLVVFVSNDYRRLPVYVEANIVVGSIKAFLQPYIDYRAKKPETEE